MKLNGQSEIPKFTVPHLRMIIRYVFNDERAKQSKLNKPDLVRIALEKVGQWFIEEEAHFNNMPQLQVPAINMDDDDPSTVSEKQLM